MAFIIALNADTSQIHPRMPASRATRPMIETHCEMLAKYFSTALRYASSSDSAGGFIPNVETGGNSDGFGFSVGLSMHVG